VGLLKVVSVQCQTVCFMPFKGHRRIISFVRYEVLPVVNMLRLPCYEMLQLVLK